MKQNSNNWRKADTNEMLMNRNEGNSDNEENKTASKLKKWKGLRITENKNKYI